MSTSQSIAVLLGVGEKAGDFLLVVVAQCGVQGGQLGAVLFQGRQQVAAIERKDLSPKFGVGGGYAGTETAAGVVGNNQDGSDSFPQIDGVLIPQNQNFAVIVDPTLAAHVNAVGVGFTTAATTAYAPGIGIVAWVLLEGTHVVAVQ